MAIPSKLYKYRSIDDRTKDIIVNHRVYFCAPVAFNDPFDCKTPLDFTATDAEFEQWVRKVAPRFHLKADALVALGRSGLPAGYFEKLTQKYLDEIRVSSSIFCASECLNDILMFSHYSSSHAGCCLEFDFSGDTLLRRSERVIYQDVYPNLNYFRLHDNPQEMGRRLILTKASHWAYEKEWRAIRFRMPPGFYDIKASCLTGIILGANTSSADKTKLRDWVKTRGVAVQFHQAEVDAGAFRLNVTPIT